ncbi:hypothetical protein ACMGD3_24395 [Lysinibacillus sphaericus]|uniref:hypothetical protein n=1 Tax=Lysinibacillus sphaericus TaxID=1421 RepID=UPI003F7AB49B
MTNPTNQNTANGSIYTKEVNQFTHDDASELALFIEREEQALKLMKEKLKAFVKLNGAIETNQKVWDFVPSLKWEFTPEACADMAAAMATEGKNPFMYFSLGANDLKKLGWSDAVLSLYGTKKAGSPTFKGVKLEK